MGNPEREVETTRTVKGAFSGATKLGGDPRVKAKMRLSSRARSRSWRWEQEAEGSASVFEGVLCGDPRVKAKMRLSSRARSRSWRWEQEAEGQRRRVRGRAMRPGHRDGGVVMAPGQQRGRPAQRHEAPGVGKEIQNKHVTDPNTENNIIEASLSYLIHVVVLFFLKESAVDGPAKKGKHQDRMAGGKEEYNAFFYSLVSTDTQNFSRYSESFCHFGFSDKYICFQVITSLPPPEEGPNMSFHTLDEQLDLLGKASVLSAGDDMIGVEHLEEDSGGKALLKARRSAGLMSAFSGAGGMVYMEYNKGKGAKKKDPAKRHTLFKKRYT
ncbi:DNA repair helicase XPB2 [Hordeum vulgare]|nr:DNA repair helicase XPB2 [Hordeum vulgare]